MSCRKGLVSFMTPEEFETPVHDNRSMFVPDLSLSIRDIIQRFAITGDLSALQAAQVDDGTDEFDDNGFTDLASMDIAELQELYESAGQVIKDYEAARNDVAKAKPADNDEDKNPPLTKGI